jgi:uncharacterized protein YqhQ
VVLLIAILVFSVVFPFVPPASDVAALNQLFFVLVKLLLLFPIAGVSYEVIKLASRFPRSRLLRVLVWPGMAMQRITTRPPDEGQLEVALASIGCVLAEEERFRLHPERPVPERTERYASFAAFLKGNEGG